MLSSLRQAKINWAESEVGAVSRFTRFTCEIGIARGFSSHFLSGVNWVFLWKPLLMATNLYNLFKPLTFLVSNAHFWLWHRCFLRVSPKPSSFGCIFPLWHRCFPLDFTGALFFVPSWDSAFFAPCLDFVGTCGPLHVFAKTWCLPSLLVVADIASLTPLFSWLKGVPPGINPSSRQQKKIVWLSAMTDYWETFSHRAAFRNLHCHLSMFFHGAGTTFPHVSVSPLIGPSHRSFQSNACRSVDAIGCSQSMSNVFTLWRNASLNSLASCFRCFASKARYVCCKCRCQIILPVRRPDGEQYNLFQPFSSTLRWL